MSEWCRRSMARAHGRRARGSRRSSSRSASHRSRGRHGYLRGRLRSARDQPLAWWLSGCGTSGPRASVLGLSSLKVSRGGLDRMRLHCLRCLWRWERWGRHPDMKVLARRDGSLGRPSWLRTSSQTPTMSRALATWLPLGGIFHRDMADSGRWRPCEGRPLATVRRKSDEGRRQA